MNAILTSMDTTDKKAKDQRLVRLQERLKKIIGGRLKQARLDMSLSQPDILEELARYGIERTQGSISQIEQGLRLPSLEILYVMLDRYKASANYVLGFSGSPTSPADIEDELGARLARTLGKLNKNDQEKVEEYAEFLAGFNRRIQAKWLTNAPALLNEESAEYVTSDQEGFSALLGVMRRRWGDEEVTRIIEEVAEEVPEWRDLALATRSKESGIQNG